MDRTALRETLENARRALLDAWTERGAFCGWLSSSALSTATASMAFSLSARAGEGRGRPRPEHGTLARNGHTWLCAHQNEDGGWGDTTDSPSNISTTTLCWSSLGLARDAGQAVEDALQRAEAWLREACGSLDPSALARTIRERYGEDHTFSVPILTTCALAGRLGEDGWRLVPALPFELAACPHQLFRRLRLQMVSYALPALIAIGQVRHHHRPTRNPVARVLRDLARKRTLRILGEIQPGSGGYLEAAPLTSFVAMSLIAMGLDEHPVTGKALGFLAGTVRDDGSWPIDTNLDTWVTTLAVGALEGGGSRQLSEDQRRGTLAWLLGQQYVEEHPYTHAAPGGWAWTDLSGGVPDADDSPGALLALRYLDDPHGVTAPVLRAATGGVRWLLGLQNRDGGIPTFCRGWGRLPFDRSSPDLTAHALRAWAAWRNELPEVLQLRVDGARDAAVRYLIRTQRDGAWTPLWFGNQREAREENPLYGTSRVLRAVAAVRCSERLEARWIGAGRDAVRWLLGAQHASGGFGAGPGVQPSIEETALALEALAEWSGLEPDDRELRGALHRGAAWLVEETAEGTEFRASPIGLYFARLWYSERLYPLVFTVSGLGAVERCLSSRASAAALR